MRIQYLLLLAVLATAYADAQESSALSCDDFVATQEALERFPNLAGACEGIAEVNGELYGKFTAVVRRVWGNKLTMYLPATDRTFTTVPDSSMRVLVDNRKVRPKDLVRGQEVHIYLSVDQFAKPDIEEVAFVTEEDVVIDVIVEEVVALPTTASPWPAVFGAGLFLLGGGYLLRRRRLSKVTPLALLLVGVGLAGVPPVADADTEEVVVETEVQVPGKVKTSMVQRVAIVEAVNKETRELKLINADGDRFSIYADDSVRNFDQLEPRDRIVVDYLESIAVFLMPAGKPDFEEITEVELAPLGGKPGIKAAETTVIDVTVEAINITDRLALLRTATGQLRSVKLSDRVPVEKIKVGDAVRMRITQAVAVSVREAPQS